MLMFTFSSQYRKLFQTFQYLFHHFRAGHRYDIFNDGRYSRHAEGFYIVVRADCGSKAVFRPSELLDLWVLKGVNEFCAIVGQRNQGMTAYALGVHEELRDNGVEVGSDEYYNALDKTMRSRFSEAFPGEEEESSQQSRPKPATVVAPATRSAAPKKVKLRQSQLNLIAKLKITPEQYVREFLKTES